MKKNKKTDRGKLVKHWGEKWPIKRRYDDKLGHKAKGMGIYVLYKGKKLWYVGLAEKNSLRKRLKDHTRDRHKGKWDNFSWYQVRNVRHIKDVETLLLKISDPKGNDRKGTFRNPYKVK